jgi:hypothetical protein
MLALSKKSNGCGLENRLTAEGVPPRWPCDTPLSAKAGTKFRWPVAGAQSVVLLRIQSHGVCFDCKIWGFHGGDYEEWRHLECYEALFF